MKKYEILEHKADLKIKSFGRTKEELFSNALLAMIESMKPELKKPEEKTERGIKIRAFDLPGILIDFLNEVLYLTQFNKEIYDKMKIKKFTDNYLEGELIGKKTERFGEDIKAVTHHDLAVCQRKDGIWTATILFDI